MTDRELLELAAKAAGIEGIYRGDTVHVSGIYQYPDNTYWNPLTDDGDALRLVVKLRLDLSLLRRTQNYKNDRTRMDSYAATRRAIVRAAAEIGKGMK